MNTTVVIPNYNGVHFLKKCLESVTKSTVKASVIVVDNGSTDGSVRWLKEKHPDVRLIAFSQNRGFCAAVNAGIRAADTPYVFLLNNDTEIAPDCIARLEEVMEQEPGVFSAGAKLLSMQNRAVTDTAGDLYSAMGWAYAIGKGKPGKRYTKRRAVFSNCAAAALYRKDLLERLGLFDENHFAYLEDVDIGYRARIFGYRNLAEPAAVVYHAGSGSSGSRYNVFKVTHSSRNNVYLIYKNMPFFQMLLNLPFLLAGFLGKLVFFWKKGFGKVYAKGLGAGVRLCLAPKGRRRKVKFMWKNLKNYGKIQLELWENVFRRF